MGSAQSYISSEAALTTLVVAGAIGLGYTQIGRSSTAVRSSTDATLQSDKGKKKRGKSIVVFSGDLSDKGHPNINKSQQHLTTPRALDPLPGFPGQFEPTTLPDSYISDVAATSSSFSKAKKSKKKKAKAAAKAAVATDPTILEVAASSSADYSSEISNKSRSKNLKRQPQPQSSSQMTRLLESTTSIDTDGSWTRVGSVRRHTPLSKNSMASFEATTTSDADTGLTPQTENSSPIAERGTEGEEASSFLLDIGSRESGENPQKTLAEHLLLKPKRAGVDDMLETPDFPNLARVSRVQPPPDEKPASGFSWGDYEDVRVTTDGGENDADGEDDGWGVVKTRRQRVDRTSVSTFTSSSHHQTQKASETMTKRQRQNAQKRVNEKAAKAEAESQRLAVLANHKRELERTRVPEQYSNTSGGKSSSGGMKAIVDERGKLVWE